MDELWEQETEEQLNQECSCGHASRRHCRYVDITTDPLGGVHTECADCNCEKFRRQ